MISFVSDKPEVFILYKNLDESNLFMENLRIYGTHENFKSLADSFCFTFQDHDINWMKQASENKSISILLVVFSNPKADLNITLENCKFAINGNPSDIKCSQVQVSQTKLNCYFGSHQNLA